VLAHVVVPAKAGIPSTPGVRRCIEQSTWTLGSLDFSNPAHDAPKSIEYRRDGERLLALLDGGPAFAFRRTSCDTVFAPR
jgi:hypothetical protein